MLNTFIYVSRPRGGPSNQRLLLSDVRGQRWPRVHPRSRDARGRRKPDPELWPDPFAAADGAAPTAQLGHAPLPDDVLSGSGRRLHDHEVLVQLTLLTDHSPATKHILQEFSAYILLWDTISLAARKPSSECHHIANNFGWDNGHWILHDNNEFVRRH